MSILMDALKRQQQHAVAPEPTGSHSPFWLGLLVGTVGLSAALVAGYWLGLQHQEPLPPVSEQAKEQPVRVASQQHILSALITEPARPEAPVHEKTEPSEVAAANSQVDSEQPGTGFEISSEPIEAQQTVSVERPAQASMPSLSDIDELDVTSELQQRFSQALDATSQQSATRQHVRMHNAPAMDISELDELTQRQLPAMRFEAHVYASTPAQRWVKVNGRTLQQGQWLSTDVQIVEVLPQHVLLRFQQQEFSVEALKDWSYR